MDNEWYGSGLRVMEKARHVAIWDSRVCGLRCGCMCVCVCFALGWRVAGEGKKEG